MLRPITHGRAPIQDFRLWALIFSILTSALLIGVFATRYLEVFRFTLRSSTDLVIEQSTYAVETTGTPKIDFHMKSSNPQSDGLYLWIEPSEEDTYYPQGVATVVNDDISWRADFGSKIWPLKQDDTYTFKVTDQSGKNVIAVGDVDARVYAVGVGWLLGSTFISMLASILQIVGFIDLRGHRRPEAAAASGL